MCLTDRRKGMQLKFCNQNWEEKLWSVKKIIFSESGNALLNFIQNEL